MAYKIGLFLYYVFFAVQSEYEILFFAFEPINIFFFAFYVFLVNLYFSGCNGLTPTTVEL